MAIDRLCRNTLDYLTLRDWAAKNGKRVVLLSNPDLDESTPSGRALSEMQATFAQLERVGGHMLLRVAFCRTCQRPLYAQKKTSRKFGYYRCLQCHMYLRMDDLEQTVDSILMFLCGELEVPRRRLVPGDDHQSRIRHIEQEIETLRTIEGTEALVKTKEAEIGRLKNMPCEPDRYVREVRGSARDLAGHV